MYIEKNVNPKNRKSCDCVVRAICTALDMKWDDVYLDLCKLGLELKDMPDSDRVWKQYLENKKLIKHSIKVTKGSKRPTVKSFSKEHKQGRFVLSVAGHLAVVVDGNYIDIWDCGDKSLYGYYEVK